MIVKRLNSRSHIAATLLASALIVSPISNFVGLSATHAWASPISAFTPAHGKVETQFKTISGKNWKDWNWLYRTVEHLARANNLSNFNWRIGIMPAPSINAFATEVNLVMAHFGLLDQVANDDAALAFIMGHEMAHNKLRHIALGSAYSEAQKAKFEQEANTEIQSLIEKEKIKFEREGIGKIILGFACRIVPRLCPLQRYGIFLLNPRGQADAKKVEEKKQEIIAQKQKSFVESVLKNSQKQEFEADREGYFYMARAGYAPSGALRALEILSRLPGSEEEGTHPAVPDRIEAIKRLIAEYPPSTLVVEGRKNLARNAVPLSIEPRTVPYTLRLGANRSETIPTIRINARL